MRSVWLFTAYISLSLSPSQREREGGDASFYAMHAPFFNKSRLGFTPLKDMSPSQSYHLSFPPTSKLPHNYGIPDSFKHAGNSQLK